MSEQKNGQPVSVNLNFRLEGRENTDGSFTLSLMTDLAEGSTLSELVIFTFGPNMLSEYTVPAGVFTGEGSRREWLAKTKAFFWRRLFDTLAREASAHMADAGNLYLDEMGIDPAPVTRKELVEIHLNETRSRVSAYLGAKGQRSQWTRSELQRAVLSALASINASRPRTLDSVARVLKKTKANKAPPSGEALGVLLKRFRLDWKELKRQTKTDS